MSERGLLMTNGLAWIQARREPKVLRKRFQGVPRRAAYRTADTPWTKQSQVRGGSSLLT